MASITRTYGPRDGATAKLGRNLAVVSREYMNLNLHLGYHFVLVDAYVGDVPADNSLYFRFLGGVTDCAGLVGRIVMRQPATDPERRQKGNPHPNIGAHQ